MTYLAPRPGKAYRWAIVALILMAFPLMRAMGSENFSDFSIQSNTDNSLLLFPGHKISEMLVNRPSTSLMTIDLPYFSFQAAAPHMMVAPHPRIRFVRISQVSTTPDVVRVSFIFHQGQEMSPRIHEGHLYLEGVSPTIRTARTTIPAPAPAAVDSRIARSPEPRSLLDQTVNMQFEEEDLSTILNALAVKFNLRVFADGGVKGKFTINARDVPLRDVLKSLLLQRNFQYTLKGRDLTVISLGQGTGRMARELLFKDLNLNDALQTLSKMMNVNLIIHESVKSKNVNFYVENLSLDELLDLLISTNDLVKKPHNDNTFIIMAKEEAKKFGLKQYRTFKLVNAKPDELVKMISGSKALADKIDISNIAVNERIGALSVYDTPENLDLIAKVIENNDEKLKQAVIELKLIEINRNSLKQLGISLDQMSIRVADIGRIPKSVTFPATLEFLESQNKAKVLSSPKIRVVHGKTANIHIGEKIPVPQFSYEVASQTLNTFERKTYIQTPVGIDLTVKPEISRDNEISLELKTTVNSVIDINKDGQIHTSDKTTDTYVRIKDGETVVLGGLISQNESINKESPSMLNRVPLIKSILNHSKSELRDTELIMLVTPHLVNLDPEDTIETSQPGLMIESH